MAMNLKLILVLITTAHLAVAALRRTPRVYNALITTDQNLTPSRSYPVIQPHLEYPAIPYGASLDPTWLNPYNPYYASGIYSPQAAHGPAYFGSDYPHHQLGIGPQLAFEGSPHFVEQAHGHRKTNTAESAGDEVEDIDESSTASAEQDEDGDASEGRGDQPSNRNEQSEDSSDEQQNEGNEGNDENNDSSNNSQNTKQKNGSNKKNQQPLPLNQFGLPPHLVPINPLYNSWNLQRQDPVNLSPYPYNSYPLIYDQVPAYQPSPFLPPYGLFTPNWSGGRSPPSSFGAGNQHGNRKPSGQDKKKSGGAGKGKGSTDSGQGDQGQQDGGNQQDQNGQGQQSEGGQSLQDGNQQDQSQQDQSQQDQSQQGQNQQDQNQQDQSQQGDQTQQDNEQQGSQKSEQNTGNSQQSQSSGGQSRSGSTQSQKQSKRRRAKEYPLGDTDMTSNIRNFNPINRNVPDVPPPPPPSGAKDTETA